MEGREEAQRGLWTPGTLRQHLRNAALEVGARPQAQARCPTDDAPDVHSSTSLRLLSACKEAGCCVLSPATGRAEQGAVLSRRGSLGSAPSPPSAWQGHPLGSVSTSSGPLRPGCGHGKKLKVQTSEQGDMTHRWPGGYLRQTGEAEGVGQVGTAGPAAGEVLKHVGEASSRPFREGSRV